MLPLTSDIINWGVLQDQMVGLIVGIVLGTILGYVARASQEAAEAHKESKEALDTTNRLYKELHPDDEETD